MKDTGWRVASIVMMVAMAAFGLWANSLQTKIDTAVKKADTLAEKIGEFQAAQSEIKGWVKGIAEKMGVPTAPPVNVDSIVKARVDSLMKLQRPEPIPLPSE